MRTLQAIPFPVRLAAICWLVLLTAVTCRVLVSKPTDHSVVPIYRVAAERWLAAEPLYAPAPPLDVYRNPPGFAAAFAPFTLLPENLAAVLWRLLSCAALLLALRSLAQTMNWSPTQSGWCFTIAAVLSVSCVDNGQVNILMAACVVFGFTAVRSQNLTWAAVALALATALKVYPVAAALLAVLVVPRLGLRYAVAVAVLAVLPFAVRPAEYVLGEYGSFWTHSLLDDRSRSSFLFRVPHDWTVIPRTWLGAIVPAAAAKGVALAVGAAFAIIVRRRASLELAFVLGSVWMTLLGPATELPTYVLLAPAAAAWVVMHPSTRSVLAIALLAVPIVRGLFPPDEALMFRSAAPLGALLLAFDAIAKTRSTRRSQILSERFRVPGCHGATPTSVENGGTHLKFQTGTDSDVKPVRVIN